MRPELGPTGYIPRGPGSSTLGLVSTNTRLRLLIFAVAIASGFLVYQTFSEEPVVEPLPELTFSQLLVELETGTIGVLNMTQGTSNITVLLEDGTEFRSVMPPGFSDEFVDRVLTTDPNVTITAVVPRHRARAPSCSS